MKQVRYFFTITRPYSGLSSSGILSAPDASLSGLTRSCTWLALDPLDKATIIHLQFDDNTIHVSLGTNRFFRTLLEQREHPPPTNKWMLPGRSSGRCITAASDGNSPV